MNNLLKICMFILFTILILFTQFYVIGSKTLFGIKPNLILVLIVIASLYFGYIKGSIYALSVGIILDFIYSLSSFGMYTIAYTLVSLVIGYLKEKYIKVNIISSVYLTLIGSAIFEIFEYCILLFAYGVNIGIARMVFGIVLFAILNCVIGVIIYNVFNRIFQKSNINVYF